jgi:ribosomal protein S19E (S16A)
MGTTNIENYLESFAKQVVVDARKNLAASKGDTELSKTIRFKILNTFDGITIQFLMDEYGSYVDKGVKGKGGVIKSGTTKGNYGGRRWYTTWKGKRKDSPFKFGTGTGAKGGLTKGLFSWIKKKGIKGRDKKGRFISHKSLSIAMARSIYIRGIHGISFFQNSLGKNYKNFEIGFLQSLKDDILQSITVNKSDI